jgi:hypothetical protein
MSTKKPVRAYRLVSAIEADSAHELAAALVSLADQIERDEITRGAWGGPSSGGIYELLSDPSMTHDRYFESLKQYLSAIKQPDQATEAA